MIPNILFCKVDMGNIGYMDRKRFTAEQIINMLREAEVLFNQGSHRFEPCQKDQSGIV